MAARYRRSAELDNAYERERQQRISDNQQRLGECLMIVQMCLRKQCFLRCVTAFTQSVDNSALNALYRQIGNDAAKDVA